MPKAPITYGDFCNQYPISINSVHKMCIPYLFYTLYS